MNRHNILFLSLCLLSNLAFAEDSAMSETSFIILVSVASLALLGLLFGLGLGLASKFLEVKTDARIAEIAEILPQAQCGMCGTAGCSAFAEAVVKGKVAPNGCKPGGEAVAKKIGAILGIEVEATTPMVATVLCTRKNQVKKIKDYQGIQDCVAAKTLGTNIYECPSACIGLGTCVRACPSHGIYMDENNMPVITDICGGCGKCVQACPVHVLRLTPKDQKIHVLCIATDLPKYKVKAHRTGACIACGKCAKACPQQAIVVENNVATIDYTKCINCGQCVSACPTKAIADIKENHTSK